MPIDNPAFCDTIYLDEILIRKELNLSGRGVPGSRGKRGENMSFGDTFKALSVPVRREILNMLKNGAMPAGEIASKFDMTPPTVSYHLAQLKKAGLVTERREKNFIYYELNASVFEELMLWAESFMKLDDPG